MQRLESLGLTTSFIETERVRRLSFKQIQEYFECPACYFGKRIKKTLDKPPENESVHIGIFLGGVISQAHSSKKEGLKFKSVADFIGFALYRYADTLLGRELEETREFLDSITPKQKQTVSNLLASYYRDNRNARVLASEKTAEGEIGGGLVWGRIDQLREGRDSKGRKVIEIVEMKFNQGPTIENSLQTGIYRYLEEEASEIPIVPVIYNLLDRTRYVLESSSRDLIPEVVQGVRLSINAGFDGAIQEHKHYLLKKRFGGGEGTPIQFEGWGDLTKSTAWFQAQETFKDAQNKLLAYFASCKWKKIDLREE